MNCRQLKTDHVIDFPEVRQSKNYTCGVSALQAILYYYGISYREDELETLLATDPRSGTPPSAIVRLCRQLGLHVKEKHNMSIAQVKRSLRQKIPVLTVFQAWGSKGSPEQYATNDNGHYSVIIGIVEAAPGLGPAIIFEDPLTIGKVYLKMDDFVHRWHDQDANGQLYQRYGIMISGPTAVYDSQLICEIE